MNDKRLKIILSIAAGLLAIPFVAMRFTDEVNWSPLDFLVMAVLLLGTGLAAEFTLRKVTKTNHRLFLVGGILALFLLVWAELAVGIFGTPLAGS